MPQISVDRVSEDIWVVALVGEHDLSMAQRLRTRLAEVYVADARIILDLTETTFIDSTVLGVIFDAAKQALGSSGDTLAIVVAPGSSVDRTLELAGFWAVFPSTYQTRDEALAAWGRKIA